MRTAVFLSALSWSVACAPAWAADYSKVDRTIRKEPVYDGLSQKYALLLFGAEAKLRVWVVLDGETVYIDRNADGDLTGKGKRFPDLRSCKEVELTDADGQTRYIIKGISTHFEQPNVESLDVDVEIKGPVSYWQYCGVELHRRPTEAHIAHFHGPLTMGPQTVNWKVPADLVLVTGDKPTNLRGHVATQNAEHGCWVVVRTHNGDASAFPADVFPVVDVEFPAKVPGAAPVRKRYRLDKFC
jgi:hypothetical protein